MPIVLMSGPMAAGKSSVAERLIGAYGFRHLKSSGFLRAVATLRGIKNPSRGQLQELGDALDVETDFRWLLDAVAPELDSAPQGLWLIDSVRKPPQVRLLKEKYGHAVLHAHFIAKEPLLRNRYLTRAQQHGDEDGALQYEIAIRHPNEMSARSLVSIADLLIDLSSITPIDGAAAVVRAVESLPA